VSGALRGSTHDLRAARIWGIIRHLAAAGLIVLADNGYQGHLAKAIHGLQTRKNHQMKRLTRSTVRTRPGASGSGRPVVTQSVTQPGMERSQRPPEYGDVQACWCRLLCQRSC